VYIWVKLHLFTSSFYYSMRNLFYYMKFNSNNTKLAILMEILDNFLFINKKVINWIAWNKQMKNKYLLKFSRNLVLRNVYIRYLWFNTFTKLWIFVVLLVWYFVLLFCLFTKIYFINCLFVFSSRIRNLDFNNYQPCSISYSSFAKLKNKDKRLNYD